MTYVANLGLKEVAHDQKAKVCTEDPGRRANSAHFLEESARKLIYYVPVELPAGIARLDAALADVDRDALTHGR